MKLKIYKFCQIRQISNNLPICKTEYFKQRHIFRYFFKELINVKEVFSWQICLVDWNDLPPFLGWNAPHCLFAILLTTHNCCALSKNPLLIPNNTSQEMLKYETFSSCSWYWHILDILSISKFFPKFPSGVFILCQIELIYCPFYESEWTQKRKQCVYCKKTFLTKNAKYCTPHKAYIFFIIKN